MFYGLPGGKRCDQFTHYSVTIKIVFLAWLDYLLAILVHGISVFCVHNIAFHVLLCKLNWKHAPYAVRYYRFQGSDISCGVEKRYVILNFHLFVALLCVVQVMDATEISTLTILLTRRDNNRLLGCRAFNPEYKDETLFVNLTLNVMCKYLHIENLYKKIFNVIWISA